MYKADIPRLDGKFVTGLDSPGKRDISAAQKDRQSATPGSRLWEPGVVKSQSYQGWTK